MEHVAWPGAVVVLGVLFLFLFRPQIAGFLSRVRSVGRTGVSTTPPPEQHTIEQQADASAASEIQALLQSFDSPVLLEQENAILADLRTRKLYNTSDTTKLLVRYLAKTQLTLACEFVYRHIFGSQIYFLKQLNTVAGGVPEEEARRFYGMVAQQHQPIFTPDQPEPYFGFLIRQGLMVLEGGRFVITNMGREFLTWLVQSGANENKPL